ncbi:DoxX family protein [Adhaeribacter swui]|uniref:DoxX family protein n=1 Tax=Adhaeribacter swui TaxID=2086471 RepID=A0A7G7GC03_9BACT|nr:DoxX family protein [Adhaeribacter swui]QNF34687.1 DoxX family protein [Adhaeribacter swui]
MSKRNKIMYWVATLWLALGMFSTGLVQLLRVPAEVENITQLVYPEYFLTLLGTWKILGVIAVLIPGQAVVKEWAYAGFFLAMSGATFSRIAAGSSVNEVFPSLLLLVLTIVSWYFRPPNRKVVGFTPNS